MKDFFPENGKLKSSIPVISLLLTIAVLAVTCASIVFRYASERSYHRRWKDYDDCGLA